MTTRAPARDKGKNKERDNTAPGISAPPATGTTETAAPTAAPRGPKEKSEKRKYETVAPPPAAAAPRISPPPAPEKKHENLPEATNPNPSVEKPKYERPADLAPKMKKEPPSANAPVNPPAARDEGGKKQKKNEPATSPTP
ncbi:MAG TPA: hypothetical protein VF751_07355 [Chthoniobacterales bacterium]